MPSRAVMNAILSETLAPPMIASIGRFGVAISPSMTSSSGDEEADHRGLPFIAVGTATIDASWSVAGAEGVVDVDVAQCGDFRGEVGVVLLLRGSKRRFSSTSTSPGFSAGAAAVTAGPNDLVGGFLHWPAEQFTEAGGTASILRSGRCSGSPSGRPRWLMAMTHAPASSRCLMVGSAARMRRSLVTSPRRLVQRHVEIDADQDVLPAGRPGRRGSSWHGLRSRRAESGVQSGVSQPTEPRDPERSASY